MKKKDNHANHERKFMYICLMFWVFTLKKNVFFIKSFRSTMKFSIFQGGSHIPQIGADFKHIMKKILSTYI